LISDCLLYKGKEGEATAPAIALREIRKFRMLKGSLDTTKSE
jgi:hypothetical protein